MQITRRSSLAGALALGAFGAAGCSRQAAPASAIPTASEGRVEVTGGSVVWRRFGGGDKIPLLLIHGGPGVPSDYLEPLAALGDERPVFVWDQLGCGRSDRPSGAQYWTRERFVDELARVRTALGLTRVHILGHSWGTMLATDYVLAHGADGVASLVMAGAALSAPRYAEDARAMVTQLPADQQRIIAEAERAGNFDTPEYRAVTEAFYAVHLARHPTAETGPMLERAFAGLGQECYVAMNGPSEFSILGSLKDYNREGDIGAIQTPTLFVSGEFDTCTPDAARHYASLMPNARAETIADAGHLTTIDAPDETNAVVRAFLREND